MCLGWGDWPLSPPARRRRRLAPFGGKSPLSHTHTQTHAHTLSSARSIARADDLWRRLCIEQFNVPVTAKPPSFKALYRCASAAPRFLFLRTLPLLCLPPSSCHSPKLNTTNTTTQHQKNKTTTKLQPRAARQRHPHQGGVRAEGRPRVWPRVWPGPDRRAHRGARVGLMMKTCTRTRTLTRRRRPSSS